jgi:hypothetical protein
MQSMVAIVDSTWTENVGDLFVFLSPVGILYYEDKESPLAGATCQRDVVTTDRRLMAFYRRVLAEFGDHA